MNEANERGRRAAGRHPRSADEHSAPFADADLAPDLAARPTRGVHVGVGIPGANALDEFLEGCRFSRIEPLCRRADQVGWHDDASDRARRRRARRFAATSAEKHRDATVDTRCRDVDVREEHDAIGDKRRGPHPFEVVVSQLVFDRLGRFVDPSG